MQFCHGLLITPSVILAGSQSFEHPKDSKKEWLAPLGIDSNRCCHKWKDGFDFCPEEKDFGRSLSPVDTKLSANTHFRDRTRIAHGFGFVCFETSTCSVLGESLERSKAENSSEGGRTWGGISEPLQKGRAPRLLPSARIQHKQSPQTLGLSGAFSPSVVSRESPRIPHSARLFTLAGTGGGFPGAPERRAGGGRAGLALDSPRAVLLP